VARLENSMTEARKPDVRGRRLRSAGAAAPALALIALAALGAAPAYADHHAQGKPGHPGGPDPDRMAEALELTDEQRVEVDEIMNEARRQREAAMTELGSGATRAERMERMRIIRDDTRSKLSEVLSDEQLKKMDTMRERHRARRMEHHPDGPKTKSEY
jgi:Spy/CpxP family protein refolding chaperone